MNLFLGTEMILYYPYINNKQTNYTGDLLDSISFLINKAHRILLQEKENAVQNVVVFFKSM